MQIRGIGQMAASFGVGPIALTQRFAALVNSQRQTVVDLLSLDGLVGYFNGDDLGSVGSAIPTWTNRVSGVQVSQATVARQPIVDTWIDGSKCATFAATQSQVLMGAEAAICSAVSGTSAPYTVMVIYQRSDAATDKAVFAAGASAGAAGGLAVLENSSLVPPRDRVLITWGTPTTTALTGYGTPSVKRATVVACVRDRSGNAVVYDNGKATTSQRPAFPTAIGQNPFLVFAIGGNGGQSTQYFTGRIRAVLVFATAITDATYWQVCRYFGMMPSNVVCVGDSITSGYGVPSASAYPSLLSGLLNGASLREWYVMNFGVNGTLTEEFFHRWCVPQYTAQYNTQPTSDVSPDAAWRFGERGFFDVARRNVLVVMGSNSLSYGAPYALTQMAHYVERAAYEGWLVYQLTALPRGPATFPSGGISWSTWMANQEEYNRGLLASRDSALYGYRVLDVAALLPNPLDLALYQGDQVHLTASGNAVLANAVNSELALLP